MAKAPDPKLLQILEDYGETPREAMWDCHGTWVIYHRAIERIAARAKITFDMPEIVEAKSADKIVAIVARGFMGDRSEWSFGEAAPGNNKNSYPYAMAEKRAKDRVVLKLVGLHGMAYSEEESDDFRSGGQPDEGKVVEMPKRKTGFREDGTRTSHSLRQEGFWAEFEREVRECQTPNALTKLALAWSKKAETDKWNETWKEEAREFINARLTALKTAPDDDTFPGETLAYTNNYRQG